MNKKNKANEQPNERTHQQINQSNKQPFSVEPSVVIKMAPERVAVLLLLTTPGAQTPPPLTFLLELDAEAKRNAIRTRKVHHWHLPFRPDSQARTGNTKRLPAGAGMHDNNLAATLDFDIKQFGPISASDPVGHKVSTCLLSCLQEVWFCLLLYAVWGYIR
jgi:hypothetical protein